MADPNLHSTLQHFIYLGVAPSTRLTYQSGTSSFLKFCTIYSIPPYPTSTLTLQFFCAHFALHVSYKTIKVYLAGIRLAHLEMVRRLPRDKLTDVKQTVVSWFQKKDPKYCSLQALRSLIGKLQHASKVVGPLWVGSLWVG